MANEEAVDINLLPPMTLKNCLPFQMTLKFVDSSGVPQKITLEKEEEINLFCFNLATTVCANLYLPDFAPVADIKLYNLEDNKTIG